MRIKRIGILTLGLITVVLLHGLTVSAQELTKEAKIERIFARSNVGAMVDQLYAQFKEMTASYVPPGVTLEQRARAQEVEDKVMDVVKTRLSWNELRPQFVKIYSDTFSDEEISGLLAFYESPAGRAMMEKMPLVRSKTMAVAQAAMSEIMPEIERIAKEEAQK